MEGPLSGLKIVELAGIGPAPFACMMFADLGADVIRIEREYATDELKGISDVLRRSRPGIKLNIKSDEGRDFVLELCEQADALIEGFRPGVTERLGLGPDDIRRRNPKLVYGRMTGYGQEGQLSARAGHDINYISITGALWSFGRAGDLPVPPLNLVGDFGGGALYLAFGVVSAILSARLTGEGQVVDAAMVDGVASMMAMTHSLLNAGEWTEERGVNLLDSGAPFYEVYETKDHRFVAVGALEEKFYLELLKGLDIELSSLPHQMDKSQWPVVKSNFSEVFRTKTRDEWMDVFDGVDACVTPVLSPQEAVHHPFNVEREVFDIEKTVQPQPAPRFSRTPASIKAMPEDPMLAARQGLESWGISHKRFADMHANGVLR